MWVAIRDSKFLKVNNYYVLILEWWRNANILQRKIVIFFGIFGQKTWRAGQKLETFHVETLYPALKKPGKQKNLRAALHCEFLIWNTQIFSKYFHNFDQQKYLDSFFKEMFNWFPQFYLHPVCCMFELQLILWQFLLLQQLVPKY